MRKIIDLTHDITHQMPVFPADPSVGILRHHDYSNGYFVSQVIFGTHSGTHIDVPVHRLKNQKTVDQVEIEKFTRKAFVMDFTFIKPLEEITPTMLERYVNEVKEVSAVIIKTGWAAQFGKEDFFTSFPGLAEDAANWFFQNGIELIGLESPSVNATKHLEVHRGLLEKEIYIVESLANVDKLSKEYVEFFAVPLKLKGLDGSPVRAFAIEE